MSHKSNSVEGMKERAALAAEGMPIPNGRPSLPSTYFVTSRTLLVGSGPIIIGHAGFVLRAFLCFALRLFARESIELTSATAPDRSAEELCVEVSILACFNTSPVLRNLDYQNA
jgi:hypothetical protein